MPFSDILKRVRAAGGKYRRNLDLNTPPIEGRAAPAAASMRGLDIYKPPVLRGGKTDLSPAPGLQEDPMKYLAEPARKEPTDWGARLGKGLSAAAYAMQANVGRPIAGQQWRQGLLRGIAGIGAMKAGEAAEAAKQEDRKQSLADQLTLLREKQAGKAAGPSWEEKFTKTEAGKMERLEKSLGAISARVKTARQMSINSATTDKDKADWKWAWDKAIEAQRGTFAAFDKGNDAVLSAMAQANYNTLRNPKRGEPEKPVSPPSPKD